MVRVSRACCSERGVWAEVDMVVVGRFVGAKIGRKWEYVKSRKAHRTLCGHQL